jgi:hypothetical protein
MSNIGESETFFSSLVEVSVRRRRVKSGSLYFILLKLSKI